MKTVKELLQSGYNFEPSQYFSKGWKLLSKHLGPLVGMTLLFVLIGIFAGSVPYINLISNLLGVILFSGFYIFLGNSMDRTQDAKDFFGGFQFAGEIIGQRLVFILFFIPFVLFIFLLGFPVYELVEVFNQSMTPEELGEIIGANIASNGLMMFFAIVVLFVGGMYLYVSYIFAIPLIVVGKLKFWNAMETSRKLVGNHFYSYFFSIIALSLLVAVMVVFTCGLGIFIALPLMSCVVYSAFDEIFKPHDDMQKSDLDEFGSSPGESNSEAELD